MKFLSEPDYGVDLFIMLSGFLMVYQYNLRASKEPWPLPETWLKFWIRRFFRIAPLYYLMLLIALALGPAIYQSRLAIDAFNGVDPQLPTRYLDFSARNIFAHASFLFGAHPWYAFRTPLPDWSIGLEMQFYAAFPFLMIFYSKMGHRWFATVLVASALLISIGLAQLGIRFPMPSFLPLKMNVFAAGMLCAMASQAPASRIGQALAMVAICAAAPVWDTDPEKAVVRASIALLFFALTNSAVPVALDNALKPVQRALATDRMRMLGELSFGAYLIHLLIMQPIGAALIDTCWTELSAAARCLLLAIATTVPTYACAWIAYRGIELPGQALGRRIVTWLSTRWTQGVAAG